MFTCARNMHEIQRERESHAAAGNRCQRSSERSPPTALVHVSQPFSSSSLCQSDCFFASRRQARKRERERSSSWSAHSPVVKEAHVRRLSNQREAEEQCCWRERSRGRLRSCQSVILSCSSFLPLRRSAYVMDDTHTQDSRRVTSPGETGGERNRETGREGQAYSC